MSRLVWSAWVMLALGGLAACDNGPSAVETRERGPEAVELAAADAAAAPVSRRGGDDGEATPLHKGKPMWSSNSRNTAEENARRLFERDGADFGAASVDDYVARAHAFIADPPAGTQTLRRANGDTLYYAAADNTFVVATREGAPRTMFKPDEGAAYWETVKAREAQRDNGEG